MKIRIIKFKKIMPYILMVIILLSSGTPMLAAYYQPVLYGLLFSSFLNFFVAKAKISKQMFIIVITLMALLLITMIISGDKSIMHYIGISIYIVSTFVLTESINSRFFIQIYVKIITIIAAYSVILTLYSNLNLSFAGSLPIITAGNNQWHHIGIFYNYWGWSQWSSFIRNSACFREPGVWGCYVTLALLLEINRETADSERVDKTRMIRCVILTLGAVSSFSTTGILCLMLAISTYFARNAKVTGRKLLVAFVGVVGFIGLLVSQGDRLFGKFNTLNSSYISLEQRSDGIRAGISMFLKNPLFGSGYSEYISNIVGTSANSYVDVLGKYGIFFTGIIVLGLMLYIKRVKRNSLVKLLVTAYFVISLGTQNILLYPVFMSLSFYGLKNRKRVNDYEQ